jgi:hypothetical protein
MKRKRTGLSRTSAMHYAKLVFRSCLLLAALTVYVRHRLRGTGGLYDSFARIPGLLLFIWGVFMLEMILRLFPAEIESMGCQKQFRRNYRPDPAAKGAAVSHRGVGAVVLSWLALNALIALLYFSHAIDEGILLLISLAYSVCDMVCILFFCPFQTLFMKNRCCTTCRIYNWDFAMMFTPMALVPRFYTWSLLFVSLVVLAQWEWRIARAPALFCEESNESLRCANCREKLCHHKKQLHTFFRKNRIRFYR